VTDADPLHVATANGVGEWVERVADQTKNVLDPNLLEYADQNVGYRLRHLCLSPPAERGHRPDFIAAKRYLAARFAGNATAAIGVLPPSR
jgi:hypothetical protein